MYRGSFLHGKRPPDDDTHGCICERSEHLLAYLWTRRPGPVDARVEKRA